MQLQYVRLLKHHSSHKDSNRCGAEPNPQQVLLQLKHEGAVFLASECINASRFTCKCTSWLSPQWPTVLDRLYIVLRNVNCLSSNFRKISCLRNWGEKTILAIICSLCSISLFFIWFFFVIHDALIHSLRSVISDQTSFILS